MAEDASEKQHQEDVDAGFHMEIKGSIDGGKCLNRHISPFQEISCSHRWQGYKRALDNDSHLYNWPRYASLSSRRKVRTDAVMNYVSKAGDTYPVYPEKYRLLLDAPKKKEWDVGVGSNFKWSYVVPYIHNSHHIVTNSELRNALNKAGAAITDSHPLVNGIGLLRGGLLRAEYNLNHKNNMIILPGDSAIAGVLNLPRHLDRLTDRAHPGYSKMVKQRLNSIINDYKSDVEGELPKGKEHVKVKHALAKSRLEALSTEFYGLITAPARAADYTGTLNDLAP
jgi:A nuclease family of the HNH/ENDO VII superfamily with conserved AHH